MLHRERLAELARTGPRSLCRHRLRSLCRHRCSLCGRLVRVRVGAPAQPVQVPRTCADCAHRRAHSPPYVDHINASTIQTTRHIDDRANCVDWVRAVRAGTDA
jgi:hypothetical protein